MLLFVAGLDRNGAVLGTLTFWVRLKVPMDQALRLYKVYFYKTTKSHVVMFQCIIPL